MPHGSCRNLEMMLQFRPVACCLQKLGQPEDLRLACAHHRLGTAGLMSPFNWRKSEGHQPGAS